jgi:hypothetical protein
MNTQRREDRWRRRCCTQGWGVSRAPGDGSSSRGWSVFGRLNSAPIARHGDTHAMVGTAPPAPGKRVATNSLQLDCRIIQLVQLVRVVLIAQFVQLVGFLLHLAVWSAVQERHDKRHNTRNGPPSGAALGEATGTLAIPGSSLSFIPSPSALDCLHPTLPQLPAGRRRWTERYDGKGNLHLLHAA